MNFIYVKEFKKCMYSYKNFWNSCTAPATSFEYDGSATWTEFSKMINQLHLNDSIVTVDFDASVVIDPSWKCQTATLISSSDSWRTYSYSRSTLYGWSSSTTRYVLENGCLRESSYSSYSHRYSYRLCVTDPVNRYAAATNESSSSTYISAINPQTKFCPTNWFDLNGRCYRISDERKTIEQARNSCISASSSIQSNILDKPRIWLIDSNGHVIGGDELSDSPSGKIVEYMSEWQGRLGFFLLDTDPDNGIERLDFVENKSICLSFDFIDNGDTDTTTAVQSLNYDKASINSDGNDTVDTDHGAINEFHLLAASENKTISMKNNTCVIFHPCNN